jgi:hypothetical protein
MQSRTTYHHLPREAWRFDTAAALCCAQVPVHHLPPDHSASHIKNILLNEGAVA